MKPTWKTKAARAWEQFRVHGWRLFWYRYVVRPRILSSTPVPCPPDSAIEVHMQICRRDWLNGLWTLTSLTRVLEEPFRVVILQDGSVGETELDHYRRLFPGVIMPTREDTASSLEARLAPVAPTLARMWREGTYFTLPKVVDSWLWARNRRWWCVDPDVLFFRKPLALLNFLEEAGDLPFLWNLPQDKGHCDGTYCFTPAECEGITGVALPMTFQIGCGGVDAEGFDWELAEKLFSSREVPRDLVFMVDQTLFGLFAAAKGVRALPREAYAIEPVTNLDGVVARHYYGKTRDLMYVEGLRAMVGGKSLSAT